jgi:hypothetical protein
VGANDTSCKPFATLSIIVYNENLITDLKLAGGLIPFLSSNYIWYVFSHPAMQKLIENKLGLLPSSSGQAIERFFAVRYAMRMGTTEYKMVWC